MAASTAASASSPSTAAAMSPGPQPQLDPEKPAAPVTTPAPAEQPAELSVPTVPEELPDATPPAPPPPPPSAPPAPQVQVDSEDELDDLDDMLDEFDAPEPKPTEPTSSKAPSAATNSEVPPLDEDWARQLQMGMADLLNDVGESPEMQAQFEHLAKELNDAMASAQESSASASGSGSGAKAVPVPAPAEPVSANFQDRLKQAMDRMKNSNEEVGAAVADTEGEDFLAEMLKQLQGSAGGQGGEEDFSGMLVNMMEQLTSKEILYEPMKELADKYPEWLKNNEGKESKEDMERYRDQFKVVKEIVVKFEEPGYKDENETDREYIVERMQKMQSAGAPPQELMGDVQPDLDIPGDVDPDCAVQ